MKTLSDFKRAMTKGSKWYRKHVNDTEFEERVVTRVCSDHVYVKDNDGLQWRLDFPRASEFEINEFGDVEIYTKEDQINELPRRLILTYRKAEN